MTAASRAAPGAPPLDPELERLLRRMRLPYIRNAAPELLATAKAQRWDPAEVLKALLVEEVSGRDRSALATRRARAGFPTGKTFAAWDPELSSIPAPTQQALRTLEWVLAREPDRVWARRPLQDVPARAARRLVQPGIARRAGAPPPR
jgi:hypothetical protein